MCLCKRAKHGLSSVQYFFCWIKDGKLYDGNIEKSTSVNIARSLLCFSFFCIVGKSKKNITKQQIILNSIGNQHKMM